MKYVLPHDPYDVAQAFLGELPKRQSDVLVRRFGLGATMKKKTLEEIGQGYGITRERIRQIEEAALYKIRKEIMPYESLFAALEEYLKEREHIVSEEQLFEDFGANDKRLRNFLHFFLVIGEGFSRNREDEYLHHRWLVSNESEKFVRIASLSAVRALRKEDRVFTREEVDDIVSDSIRRTVGKRVSPIVLEAWIRLSKLISKNEFDQWGPTDSPLVNPRGVRDYSYLVFRKLQKPLHFTDVAKNIRIHLKKPAQSQTVHNELIKDDRFVLIGRGLYGLAEWGHEPGFVKDVIKRILNQSGPLSQRDIVKNVLNQRDVKENTIVINLKNSDWFNRLPDGRYKIAR